MRASQRYLNDKDFSKEPTAICDHIRLGFDACNRGEGKYCYCNLSCTSKTELNGSGRMIKEERDLLNSILSKALGREIDVEKEVRELKLGGK